ncbi:MAG: serine/threonine-protein phosphatase [Chloroflexi bacterium]|nr:serine/threonine-protein phosphatase [Chloroflexota bacterium]
MANIFQSIRDFFSRIFSSSPSPNGLNNEATTAPLSQTQIEDIDKQSLKSQPPQLIAGSGRHVGRQRDNNEDALFSHTATIAVDSNDVPFGLYIVADGMGGHRNGEIASENAVRAMSSYVLGKLVEPLFGPNPGHPEESLQEIMHDGVIHAHQVIMENAPGGGSTLTAALVMGNQMTVAHVGDSRAYAVYFDGRMQVLTRDHSLVKRLEELGQITSDEAAVHPQKSMLYRALGQGEPSEPDVFNASLPQPGYLLICSDGLWGLVSDDAMFDIITAAPSPHKACQQLVDAANAAGGQDNIAVTLVRMSN